MINEERQIDKYKQLLQGLDTDNSKVKGDVQMEITWETGKYLGKMVNFFGLNHV